MAVKAWRLGIVAAAVVLGGSGAVAARNAYWRPVMPEVQVYLRTADGTRSPNLIIIYGEKGSDAFQPGPLGPDRRITACRTQGAICISHAARDEWRPEQPRRQSLQILNFSGNGNPILGGVMWNGHAYPRQVRVTCDLRIADRAKRCAITGIAV